MLQILTYDVEPMIEFERVTYYESDDHSPTEGHDDYVAWLGRELDLAPVEDAAAIVEAAQKKHQTAFVAWLKRYAAD